MMGKYARLYALVKQIPEGKVATYGQLARLTSMSARQVGFAMAATPSGQHIPWHRVINSQGKLSVRTDGKVSEQQFQRLQAEGLPLSSPTSRIDLTRCAWQPTEVLFADEGAEEGFDERLLDIPGQG